ncbi:hypothetical protein B0T13DRAFT_449138 [Neurospora crassa]|nr:hypothetical protein B0T13DRAFT_449138 [Neurospora crassa]
MQARGCSEQSMGVGPLLQLKSGVKTAVLPGPLQMWGIFELSVGSLSGFDEPLTVRNCFLPGAARVRFTLTILCRGSWKSRHLSRKPWGHEGDGRFVLMGGSVRIGLWIQAVSGDGLGSKRNPDGDYCGRHTHSRRHIPDRQTFICLSWLYHVLLRKHQKFQKEDEHKKEDILEMWRYRKASAISVSTFILRLQMGETAYSNVARLLVLDSRLKREQADSKIPTACPLVSHPGQLVWKSATESRLSKVKLRWAWWALPSWYFRGTGQGAPLRSHDLRKR